MKETLKKYGKYLTSFAGLSALLSIPMAALGAVGDENLQKFTGATNVYNDAPGPDSLVQWIGKIVGLIISFLGVILVLYIIWAGFIWMTAGGDTKKVDDAKAKIKNAVIGIIIVFAAYAITTFVTNHLSSITQATGN